MLDLFLRRCLGYCLIVIRANSDGGNRSRLNLPSEELLLHLLLKQFLLKLKPLLLRELLLLIIVLVLVVILAFTLVVIVILVTLFVRVRNENGRC